MEQAQRAVLGHVDDDRLLTLVTAHERDHAVGAHVGALVATVPFRLWLLVPVAAAWAGVTVLLAESGRRDELRG